MLGELTLADYPTMGHLDINAQHSPTCAWGLEVEYIDRCTQSRYAGSTSSHFKMSTLTEGSVPKQFSVQNSSA